MTEIDLLNKVILLFTVGCNDIPIYESSVGLIE